MIGASTGDTSEAQVELPVWRKIPTGRSGHHRVPTLTEWSPHSRPSVCRCQGPVWSRQITNVYFGNQS